MSAARRDQLASNLGFRVVRTIPHIGWTVVEPVGGATPAQLAKKLESVAGVKAAEPDGLVYPSVLPNDPLFPSQWGYRNTGASGGTVGMDANVAPAWDWSQGSNAVVAVVDSGVDFGIDDLKNKAWVNPGEIPNNGIDDDHNGYIDDVNGWDFLNGDNTLFDARDGDKHGTHVAGTIGAETQNATSVAGLGWNTKVMSLKFIGRTTGTYTNGAAAITYAVDKGARVINCSWGGTSFSQVVADAVTYAASRGVLVVCAAGNSGVNTDVTANYPASLPATNVVSVAAIDRTGAMPSFSNYGATTVDLGAPGLDVLSSMSRVPGAITVDKPPYKVIYMAFPAESITNLTTRRNAIGNAAASLASNLSTPVLVVDDSQSAGASETPGLRLSKYTDALATKGFTNVTTWSTQTSGTPNATDMAGKLVVWFTGGATFQIVNWQTTGTLVSAERTQLATFLDGGGRLLISSGELGSDMNWIGFSALTWYTNYMHAQWVADDPWTEVFHGSPGTPLAGVNATVTDALRYSDGYDDIAPLDAYAQSAGIWGDQIATISGTSMAAPHVSGALALAISRNPGLTGTELKARLLARVTPTASLAGKTVTGGRLNTASLVGTLTAPAPLQVGPGGVGALALTWNNPTDADFSATRVLVRSDVDPTGPSDTSATVVYEGTASATTQSGVTVGSTLHYAAFSRGTLGAWSEAARVTTTVAEPPTGPGAPIPVGTNVSVTVSGVTAVFSQVYSPGWLSINRIAPTAAPPANFRWLPNGYYEIHVVGNVAMPVALRVPFDPATSADPAHVVFFHQVGGSWTNITSSTDPAGLVLASTGSFSNFGLADPLNPDGVALSAERPYTAPLLAVAIFVGLVVARRRFAAR
jgi:subtilisin family serine protease